MIGCVQATMLGGSVKAMDYSPYLVYYEGNINTTPNPDEVIDAAGNYNLQTSGTVTSDGSIITFGSSSYAKSASVVSQLLGTTKMEIEMRVSHDNASGNFDIITAAELNKRMFIFRNVGSNTLMRFFVTGTAGTITPYIQFTTPVRSNNTFYVYKIVVDLTQAVNANKIKLYIDGTEITNKSSDSSLSGTTAIQNTAASNLQLAGLAGASQTMAGKIAYAWLKKVA